MTRRKVTTTTLAQMRERDEPIAMATAYDATFASLLDGSGIDILLVGDSLGMVIQGQSTTLGVTMDHMVYHTACVARGATHSMVVADLPFLSYQVSPEDALRNGGRLIAEGGAQAVKLEGGHAVAETVTRIVNAGIPVMGHIGLTPQSIHQLGGFRAQGKDAESARRLVEEAKALQDAGAFSLVLECVPGPLAELITKELHIPTIGIGAGVHCSGQVLVSYDMLGMNEGFKPRFLKTYDTLADRIKEATGAYVSEVKSRAFPGEEHTIGGTAPVPTPIAHDDSSIPLYGGGKK